jgi:hypothetical protein
MSNAGKGYQVERRGVSGSERRGACEDNIVENILEERMAKRLHSYHILSMC